MYDSVEVTDVSIALFPYQMPGRRIGRSGRGGRGGSPIDPRAARTLAQVLDPRNLFAVLEAMCRRNGQAPGVDHIRISDLSRGEWSQLFRDVRDAVLAGTYRPQPTRAVEIPKASGGHRTLNLPTVADRVLSKAVMLALEPFAERAFLPCSYGFRPDLDRLHLLADLKRYCEANDRWVVTADDVKQAFDHVPITPAVAALARLGADPDLVALAGVILRGNSTKEVGISQGDPLSPLVLNGHLHDALDEPMSVTRDGHLPVYWYGRYADNVLVVTETATEGREQLDEIRTRLTRVGLSLKGDPGIPREFRRGGHLDLLGSRLTHRQGRLHFQVPHQAWDDLQAKLVDAHDTPHPAESARATATGWVEGHAPTFGTNREDEQFRNRLLSLLRHCGHADVLRAEEVGRKMTRASGRWQRTLDGRSTRTDRTRTVDSRMGGDGPRGAGGTQATSDVPDTPELSSLTPLGVDLSAESSPPAAHRAARTARSPCGAHRRSRPTTAAELVPAATASGERADDSRLRRIPPPGPGGRRPGPAVGGRAVLAFTPLPACTGLPPDATERSARPPRLDPATPESIRRRNGRGGDHRDIMTARTAAEGIRDPPAPRTPSGECIEPTRSPSGVRTGIPRTDAATRRP